jgi:hypothetical protein
MNKKWPRNRRAVPDEYQDIESFEIKEKKGE